MRSITLVKYGNTETSFALKEVDKPTPSTDEILIRVEAFGLNFADVLARKGMYKDAPPLPCILGYEVVGTIEQMGTQSNDLKEGDRVVAFTRFGGYAEYCLANSKAVVKIPEQMENGVAVALATQYCTAYYCAHISVTLFEGDHVLVHSAAGGVGTALVQLAKNKGCIVYGTVGSNDKFKYLEKLGVDHMINYQNSDFVGEIKKIRGSQRMDVIFDAVGGTNYRKSKEVLSYGGRLVSYGIAERTGNTAGFLSDLSMAWRFGFLHPLILLMKSQGMIGVNMLRIADHNPAALQRCLEEVVQLSVEGKIAPAVGGVFKADEIHQAHQLLEGRSSVGKIVVEW